MLQAELMELAERYQGKVVMVQCYSMAKFIGQWVGATDDLVILKNCICQSELESGTWFDEIAKSSIEDGIAGQEETLIRMCAVISISCNEPDLESIVLERSESAAQLDNEHCRFEIQLGRGLVKFAEEESQLPKRIQNAREHLVFDIGFEIPKIRIRDNDSLDEFEYEILIDSAPIANSQIRPNQVLAIFPGQPSIELDGELTTDPAFDLPAYWLAEKSEIAKAEKAGLTTADALAVLVTHTTEIIKNQRQSLLTYDLVCEWLDNLKAQQPELVGDNFRDTNAIRMLFEVLEQLLTDKVWIGCFPLIAQTVAIHKSRERDPNLLTEIVRKQMGRHLFRHCIIDNQKIPSIILEPALSEKIANDSFLDSMDHFETFLRIVRKTHDDERLNRKDLVLLLSGSQRRNIKNMIQRSIPDLTVVSYDEIPIGCQIEAVRVITLAEFASPKNDEAAPPITATDEKSDGSKVSTKS